MHGFEIDSARANQFRQSDGLCEGYATLIRAALMKRKTSTRALQRAGIINERTRRLFFEKLDTGGLSISEMVEIIRFLDINPMRALIAVAYMDDPKAYFDPSCELMSAYNEQLITAMTERAAALSGDFTVIDRTLRHCASHAKRISGEILAQQERTKLWLESEVDY